MTNFQKNTKGKRISSNKEVSPTERKGIKGKKFAYIISIAIVSLGILVLLGNILFSFLSK